MVDGKKDVNNEYSHSRGRFYELFQKKFFPNFLKIRGVGGTKLARSRVYLSKFIKLGNIPKDMISSTF